MKGCFLALSWGVGLSCIGLAWVFWRAVCTHRAACLMLPRRPVWFGMTAGTVCLAWSAYHGNAMLEGELAVWHPVVWGAVPVVAVLSYFFLDFLNARSLGGLATLCANELIRMSFVYDVPGRAVYGVVCLVLGVAGMAGIGIPWRFRDALRLAADSGRARAGFAGMLAVFGVLLCVMPLFSRL